MHCFRKRSVWSPGFPTVPFGSVSDLTVRLRHPRGIVLGIELVLMVAFGIAFGRRRGGLGGEGERESREIWWS